MVWNHLQHESLPDAVLSSGNIYSTIHFLNFEKNIKDSIFVKIKNGNDKTIITKNDGNKEQILSKLRNADETRPARRRNKCRW